MNMDENSPPTAVAALFDRLVEESLPGQRGEKAWRALLHAHATLMRQLDTDLREDTGLRLADFDVLAQLAGAGGELRMTDLAARTLISRSGLTRRGQLSQDVEVGKAQAGVLPEVGVEPAHERGMGVQHCPPCFLSALPGKRLFDKPVEESGHGDRWGILVHVHQLTPQVFAVASTSER